MENTASSRTYVGLFMVTLATLMYETLLTRIFSVAMWYHFAFMAISIALFGMTVGAIVVYLFPARFTPTRTKRHLAATAWLFSISVVVTFLVYLTIPFNTLLNMTLTYMVISIPFIFSGMCVSLALTKFPGQVSKLYAADLVGAALGCVLLVVVLGLTDGPTGVMVVAALAGIGAAGFALDLGERRWRVLAITSTLALAVFVVINTLLANQQTPLLRLTWLKGARTAPPLYEKWNSFSHVMVDGDPDTPATPFGWGLSTTYPADRTVRQLRLTIDATAATPLTAFNGDWDNLDFLKYDVINLVHYIRHNSKVLVVGVGGGRDVLSALSFGQQAVVGVEINQNIIDAMSQRYGDFTGHLDADPRVTLVADEARSFVAGRPDKYDVIQISLIDTWAATSAGAFVFTENSLYTTDAWKIFLDHLTPNGVLSVSRWYFRDRPGEVYRLTALASATLKQLGIDDPRAHLILVRRMEERVGPDVPDGVGTMLISPTPFSVVDVNEIERAAAALRFEVVLSPRIALDPTFEKLASRDDSSDFIASYPLNIAPPTDDTPYFFHMLRLQDFARPDLLAQGAVSFNMQAVALLGSLALVTIVLTVLCILVPLVLTLRRRSLSGALPLTIFFAGIGLGFMLIEISQLQRLVIFLGHPTYSLLVVLFTLLLASGLGSRTTQRIGQAGWSGSALMRLALLCAVLILFGLLTSPAISLFRASPTIVRIGVAIAILCPLGLFMGMAFPIGMKLASVTVPHATPWLWGINGALSVCASVLAVILALNWGISATFGVGLACYVTATMALAWANRRAGV